MSDAGGRLTAKGVQQVTACAHAIAQEAPAGVYASPLSRAVQSGEVASGVLELPLAVRDGLEEIRVGDLAGLPYGNAEYRAVQDRWVDGDLSARVPGAESGEEVLARFTEALQAIADLHRGERVLVFTHGAVMSFAVPRLAGNVRNDLARRMYIPNAVPARIEVGDDGWSVVSWPGSTDRSVV